MLDREKFYRTYKARRRQVRWALCAFFGFWALILAVLVWGSIEVIQAGPDGIGRGLGHFIKGMKDGANE